MQLDNNKRYIRQNIEEKLFFNYIMEIGSKNEE